MHSRRIVALLAKASQDGLTVSPDQFREILQKDGFGGYAEARLDLSSEVRAQLRTIPTH